MKPASRVTIVTTQRPMSSQDSRFDRSDSAPLGGAADGSAATSSASDTGRDGRRRLPFRVDGTGLGNGGVGTLVPAATSGTWTGLVTIRARTGTSAPPPGPETS